MNINLYKLFNPDLKNLNNYQLYNHLKLFGIKEKRIFSYETFFQKYPYYNHEIYRLNNNDINIHDKLELMVHWHLFGCNENRICSNINNENKNDDNLYIINPNKETIGVIVENNQDFLYKALSFLNYHNMNILFITEKNHIEYLKNNNILISNNYSYIYQCNYLIIDNIELFTIHNELKYEKFKKIFIFNELKKDNDKNIIYIDNLFDNSFLENKILITLFQKYIIIEDELYKIKDINNENIYNKLYIEESILNYNTYKIFNNNIIIDYLNNKIKTYIINLDNRDDRLKETIEECMKIGLNYERFSGIIINEENYVNYKLINSKKAWKNNIEYIKSASGCKLSHLEILKKYLEYYGHEEYVMILEDDVIFEDNTLYYLYFALQNLKKNDFDILYLSTNLNNINDAKIIDNNLLKINKGLTTTAQIFKKNNITKIINIIENSEIEIDNTYSNYLENKYCVYPMCVYQRLSYSDINKKMNDYGMYHKKFKFSNDFI